VGLGYDAANGFLYASNEVNSPAGRNVTVINATSDRVQGLVDLGALSWGVAVDSANGNVYVGELGSPAVVVVNGSSDELLATVSVPFDPIALAFDPSNGDVYVGGSDTTGIAVISSSTNKVVASVTTSSTPSDSPGLAVDPVNGEVFVANYQAASVAVVNGSTNKVLTKLSLTGSPLGMAFDPDNGYAYVALSGVDDLGAINATTNALAGSVPVGSAPAAVAVDPSDNTVFVANEFSANVSVINGSGDFLVGSIRLGAGPAALAFDAPDGRLYVAVPSNGTVAALAPALSVSLAGRPSPADAGVPVELSVAASQGLPPFSYSWTFGDGAMLNGSDPQVGHAYAAPGDFEVNVTVADHGGGRASATIALVVNAALVASVPKPSSASADVGQRVTFREAPSGGTPPYLRYAWTGFAGACTNLSTANVTCTFPTSGNRSISVNVTDANSVASGPSPSLTFSVLPDPQVNPPTANRTGADIGEPVGFAETLTGGQAKGARYDWTGLSEATCANVSGARPACVFAQPGFYSVAVNVTDGNGYPAGRSPSLVLDVLDLPSVAPPTANRSSADVNQTVTFSTTASGGSGGYTYAWSGLPASCGAPSTARVSCTMPSFGSSLVSAVAIDSNGGRSAPSVPLSLPVSLDPYLSAPRVSPSNATVGQLVSVQAELAGGSGNETYSWAHLPPGCSGSGANFTCTPSVAGVYDVTVSVRDGNGYVTTSPFTTLTVTPASSASSGPLGTGSATAYFLAGFALGIVAVVVALLVLRRAKPPAPPAKAAPPRRANRP
jgi:YVTN family beta-propeller protein